MPHFPFASHISSKNKRFDDWDTMNRFRALVAVISIVSIFVCLTRATKELVQLAEKDYGTFLAGAVEAAAQVRCSQSR